MVAAEEGEKAGPGAGGATAAQQLQVAQSKVQLFQVQHQVLEPEGGPLAHSGGLGRLEMGIGQGGQSLILLGKIRGGGNGVQKQLADAQQRVPLEDNIGIITHIAAGGPQVDDGPGLGAGQTVGIDMSHNVVAHLSLPPAGGLIVYIIQVSAHLVKLFIGDVQSQLLLALGKDDPQLAPGGKLPVVGEDFLHFLAGIALAERVLISVVQYRVLHILLFILL